jgi:hypothetical protein
MLMQDGDGIEGYLQSLCFAELVHFFPHKLSRQLISGNRSYRDGLMTRECNIRYLHAILLLAKFNIFYKEIAHGELLAPKYRVLTTKSEKYQRKC